jgi:hypothetical protein
MIISNRIRQETRPRASSLVFRVFLGGFLGGIVLALLIPALVTRGIVPGVWLPWAAMLGSVVLCAGPEIVRRIRTRRTGARD